MKQKLTAREQLYRSVLADILAIAGEGKEDAKSWYSYATDDEFMERVQAFQAYLHAIRNHVDAGKAMTAYSRKAKTISARIEERVRTSKTM